MTAPSSHAFIPSSIESDFSSFSGKATSTGGHADPWRLCTVTVEGRMSTNLNDNLAELLKSVRTRPLFVMHLDARMLIVGDTPGTHEGQHLRFG
jgi:hypothetical protein